MIVSLIVAFGKNMELGHNNQLLWQLPEDLKNFKKLTLDHHVIMGRKTFESIGKPLPNRTTIVVTKSPDLKIDGVTTVRSVEEALDFAGKNKETEVFICGGGQIYKYALDNNLVNKMYLTSVDWHGDADTFFPEFNLDNWDITHSETHHTSETNPYYWEFQILERK